MLPLDGLPQPNFAFCVGWRLQSTYLGNLLSMQNAAGAAPVVSVGTSANQKLDGSALVAAALAAHPADNWLLTVLNDQSGNGRNLTPLAANQGPTIFVAGDTTPQVLAGSLTPAGTGQSTLANGMGRPDSSGFLGDPALTIALVADMSTSDAGSGFEALLSLGGAGAAELCISLDHVNNAVVVFDDSLGNGIVWTLATPSLVGPRRYGISKAAGTGYDASWKLRIDGEDQGPPTTVAAGPLNITNGQTTLWDINDGVSNSLDGHIAFAAAWTSVLDAAQLAQLEGFLNGI